MKGTIADIGVAGASVWASSEAIAAMPGEAPAWVSSIVVLAVGLLGGLIREWLAERERQRRRDSDRRDLEHALEMARKQKELEKLQSDG